MGISICSVNWSGIFIHLSQWVCSVRPKTFALLHALHLTLWKKHVRVIFLVLQCLRGIIFASYSESVWFPVLEVFIYVIVFLCALSQMPGFMHC